MLQKRMLTSSALQKMFLHIPLLLALERIPTKHYDIVQIDVKGQFM